MRLFSLFLMTTLLACSESPPPPNPSTPKTPRVVGNDFDEDGADEDGADKNDVDEDSTQKEGDPKSDGVEKEQPVFGTKQQKDTGQEVQTALTLTPKGNSMQFEQTTLQAKPGLIRVTFKNTATVAAMQHNVVFVQKSTSDQVGVKGIGAGPDRGYVPDIEAVLAATRLIGPGQEDTIVMKLEADTYEYICTFPGHYLQMRGTLVVK